MVQHGKNKKRRAGRTGKTKLKNRSYAKFKPVQIVDGVIRKNWDFTKSPSVNLESMGLVSRPNNDIETRVAPSNIKPISTAVELFDVPESDVIPKKTKSQIMLPVSIEKQRFIVKCMSKYGDDYKAMSRDNKVNDLQETENVLRKLGARFLLLSPEQQRVEIPDKIKHLMASKSAGK